MTREELLQKIEKLSGGSKSKFAKLVGVTPQSVTHWLSGERKPAQSVLLLIEEIEKKRTLQKALNAVIEGEK